MFCSCVWDFYSRGKRAATWSSRCALKSLRHTYYIGAVCLFFFNTDVILIKNVDHVLCQIFQLWRIQLVCLWQLIILFPVFCLCAFLTCNRASCFTRDVTRHHHWRVSSWVMWLRVHRATTPVPKQPFALFIFLQRFSPEWPIRTCSKITAVLLLCTDDDNRSYRNVCNMSFLSFALAVIFIIMAYA